jgi:hypothetical protein
VLRRKGLTFWNVVEHNQQRALRLPDRIVNIVLIFVGILSGSLGVFLFSPTLIAIAVILVTTPFIQTIVDDILIKKWRQATITFSVIIAYTSTSVWVINLFVNAASFQDRLSPSIIIIGAGVIQLAGYS